MFEAFERNTTEIFWKLPESYPAAVLFSGLKNLPILIIAPDAELESQLSLLKDLQSRVLMITGGRALNLLSSKGIIPHIGCAWGKGDQPWAPEEEPWVYGIPWIEPLSIHPDILEAYHGSFFFLQEENDAFQSWIFKTLGIEEMPVRKADNLKELLIHVAEKFKNSSLYSLGYFESQGMMPIESIDPDELTKLPQQDIRTLISDVMASYEFPKVQTLVDAVEELLVSLRQILLEVKALARDFFSLGELAELEGRFFKIQEKDGFKYCLNEIYEKFKKDGVPREAECRLLMRITAEAINWLEKSKTMKKSRGTLKPASYPEGKLHGEVLIYHQNGQLKSRIFYRDGVKDGVEEVWDGEGSLLKRVNYSNGKPVDRAQYYYSNGKLREEIVYDPHSKPWTHRRWDKFGRLIHGGYEMEEKDSLKEVKGKLDKLSESLETTLEKFQHFMDQIQQDEEMREKVLSGMEDDLQDLNQTIENLGEFGKKLDEKEKQYEQDGNPE